VQAAIGIALKIVMQEFWLNRVHSLLNLVTRGEICLEHQIEVIISYVKDRRWVSDVSRKRYLIRIEGYHKSTGSIPAIGIVLF
jgi:hypothetical protein